MNKMAAMHIYKKNPLEYSSPEPEGRDIGTWYEALVSNGRMCQGHSSETASIYLNIFWQ